MPSASHVGVAIVIGSALLTGAVSNLALAQSPAPATQPPAPSWPSGDQLRSSLQQIDFAFRIDADSGDWLGWAPRATSAELPALGLSGAGTQDALTSFDFNMIEGDTGPPLTAFMEVAARLPLDPVDVDQARRFVVDDLLEMPPETLEACYLSDWRVGAALVTVDTETTTARLQLASSVAALDLGPDLALADCAAFVPAEVVAELGDPSTERMTVVLGGEPAAFDPSQLTVEGALVTLVLTFRNEADTEQTLTFEAPLESTTGSIAPGGIKLIVVRQLAPGEYAFYSETDPATLRGSITVEAPSVD